MKVELSLERPRNEQADYQFTFQPHDKHLRVEFAGITIADSDQVMVMRETRLPPMYYFPKENVRMDLMQRTDHQTYCPFKGNASYWTLTVKDRQASNVMWGYEDPFPDSVQIEGYVAFYDGMLDAWYENGDAVEHQPMDTSSYANPLLGWLITDAPLIKDSNTLTRELAEKMVSVDIPLLRLNLIIRTLHPQMMAVVFRWWRAKEEISERLIPYGILNTPQFLDSPLAPIFEGAGGIRRRLDADQPVLDYPILEELYKEGATDYVAMPVTFSDGQINALTLASDHRGGFSTENLGHIYEILALLARLYEVHAMRRTAVTLLETYLGRHAGERVLNGQIKRGDKQNIHAVIWFCDLRESTPLAQSLSRDEFLDTLNQFFDCMAGAVIDHDGHVLRFIGDAALAIFPLSDADAAASFPDTDGAVKSAIEAVIDAQARMLKLNERRKINGWEPLKYGIALHLGEVTYGNIGTENRLEFTVVGDAANRAARIESMCKTLDEPVLLSSELARFFPENCESLGEFTLRGVNQPLTIYALRR